MFCINSIWKIHDTLTVEQAAALIAGYEPSAVVYEGELPSYFKSETGWNSSEGISEVKAAFSALTNAINSKKLKATINYPVTPYFLAWGTDEYIYNKAIAEHGAVEIEAANNRFAVIPEPDFSKTLICVESLKNWLERKGMTDNFFFQESPKQENKFVDAKLDQTAKGEHRSKHLLVLEEASNKFWSNADPDDKTTHPTNEKVSEWLEKQGFSKVNAKQGAVMIRPEWAANGRRPTE